MGVSKFLDVKAIRGLTKIGDILTPGDSEYPSFSKLGCAEHVDRAVAYMPEQDVKDLNMLLGVFSFLPTFFLSGFLAFLEFCFDKNIPLPGMVWLIRIGLRGLVMTLYYSGYKGQSYSGRSPNELLEFKIGVYQGDEPLKSKI